MFLLMFFYLIINSSYYIFGDEDKLMATHGTLGEFDSNREDWTSYSERLEQYFQANDVESAEKQRAILLSDCSFPIDYH